MAGETKSDNKLFQLLMVVVTTVVAPVSVYFITHTIDASKTTAASTATLSSPVAGVSITATPDQPLVTPTVEPVQPQATATTAAVKPTEPAAAPTQPGIINPQGILPAGDPGIVNGMAVSVVAKEVQLKDKVASIQIHVRNQTSQKQTFVYRLRSISVKSVDGSALEVIEGDKRDGCSKKALDTERKIELAPNQEIVLKSVEANKEGGWCASTDGLALPRYQATGKEAPRGLVTQFDGFGPFKGFGFRVDW